MVLKILELFSGIGGMHYSFQYSKLPGEIVAAYDINTVANSIYAHNHPNTTVKNNNIQSLTPKIINELEVNTLLMSPPCQPYTRVGNKLDINDNRSDALQHLCRILPNCLGLRYILMENVKGFENSQAHDNFIAALNVSGYYYCEFILSPNQFGIPNSRHRYYCLARKDCSFTFAANHIMEEVPQDKLPEKLPTISLCDILEPESIIGDEFLVSDKDLMKRVFLMDIVTIDAKNTMCFTKAYTHYVEGTGSVFSSLRTTQIDEIFEKLKTLQETPPNDNKRLQLLKTLRLRYFTPREVARLMAFPESFDFPAMITNRQKYRVLGNSINVLVVGELIKWLCS